MERVTIFIRTKKTEGEIRLRFRLQDTERGKDATHKNGIDLYHKSEIKVEIESLNKFLEHINIDGTVKKGHNKFDKGLLQQVKEEMDAIKEAYKAIKKDDLIVDGAQFEDMVNAILHPDIKKIDRSDDKTLLGCFWKFFDDSYKDGVINEDTWKHYKVFWHELERYLIINKKLKTTPAEFTGDDIMNFRTFLRDEYTLVDDNRGLYTGMSERNIPKEMRSQNTVASKLKKLRAFFNAQEAASTVDKSPFKKLSRGRRAEAMRTKYDKPRPLLKEEFIKVLETAVPTYLQETKDVFLLQCNVGYRIGDFSKLTMQNLSVSSDGIPYIHKLQSKTQKQSDTYEETDRPLMRYALDIVKKYQFNFPILKNITGAMGYNAMIKELLKSCGITRKCSSHNKTTKELDYFPLWEGASSKTARETSEELSKAAQVNLYTTGLHEEGSKAIRHYTRLWLKDNFDLMCVGFRQPRYRADENLNITEESTL